jgi:hypothetical protein
MDHDDWEVYETPDATETKKGAGADVKVRPYWANRRRGAHASQSTHTRTLCSTLSAPV